MSLLSKVYPPCWISQACKAKDNRNSINIFDFCNNNNNNNFGACQPAKKKKMKEKLRILHMACLKCVKSDFSSTASKGLIPFTFNSCAFFIAHYYQY